MKTAFIIIAAQGEYDEYCEWPIVVVLSEEKAAVLVEELESRTEELLEKYNALKHPSYPGKCTEEQWEEYIRAVDKHHEDRAAVCAEHPADQFTPGEVNLRASYHYEQITLIEE